MSVRDIVEIAGDTLPTRSKTPDTVVARDLSMDIKRLGEESRFVRTAPGRYTMREFIAAGTVQMGDTGDRARIDSAIKATQSGAVVETRDASNGHAAAASATPVLGNALAGERNGVLPSKVSEERVTRRAATQEDATSL